MQSLQSITDAWGKWKAKQHKTKCMFTASTNYKKEKELKDYHEHQVKATAQPIIYDLNAPPPAETPDTVYELWFDNASSADQQQTFSKTSTSTESFTWSLTEMLTIGVELSATAGVEGVATASSTLSTELSLSSTQGGTVGSEQSWTAQSSLLVPAMSSVKCDMVVDVDQFDLPFTAPVLLQGDVAIWYDHKVDDHWLWFVNIAKVFREVQQNNLIDTSGYAIQGGGVLANPRGKMRGKEGVRVSLVVTQYPLRSSTPSAQFKAQKSYRIAL